MSELKNKRVEITDENYDSVPGSQVIVHDSEAKIFKRIGTIVGKVQGNSALREVEVDGKTWIVHCCHLRRAEKANKHA